MEAIRHLKSVRITFMHNSSKERICISLHTPGVVEIVFCAGAIQGRILFAINEEHVITFAPPASLVVLYSQVTANVMSGAFYIQNRVIIFAFKIGYVVDFRAVGLQIWAPAFARIFSSPTGMKIGSIFIQRFFIHFIVNVEIQNKRNVILIHNFKLCLLIERHWEVTGYGTRGTISAGFFRFQGNVKR